MAPITVDGHKVYGVFIEPGMGLRDNDTNGIAVDDQPEGMYRIVDGKHFNGGCCFDYGNAETDSHDDGDGTMETSYFGNANVWYHGPARPVGDDRPGEQPGGLLNPQHLEDLPDLPNVTFALRDRDGQGRAAPLGQPRRQCAAGPLTTMFGGPRVDPSMTRCGSRAGSCWATAATTAMARRAPSTRA